IPVFAGMTPFLACAPLLSYYFYRTSFLTNLFPTLRFVTAFSFHVLFCVSYSSPALSALIRVHPCNPCPNALLILRLILRPQRLRAAEHPWRNPRESARVR